MTANTDTDSALLRLLQLSSAALPVGGFSFSYGLETAVENGWVSDRDALTEWLVCQMQHGMGQVDLPILLRIIDALERDDGDAVLYWNATALACRESAELLQGDRVMGSAMMRLMKQLGMLKHELLDAQQCSFVSAFGLAAYYWAIAPRSACQGLLWAWTENQVQAAVKLVPLGQTQAQQTLWQLEADMLAAVDQAQTVADGDIGASLPSLAIASAHHETQYSRLFRS